MRKPETVSFLIHRGRDSHLRMTDLAKRIAVIFEFAEDFVHLQCTNEILREYKIAYCIFSTANGECSSSTVEFLCLSLFEILLQGMNQVIRCKLVDTEHETKLNLDLNLQ